MATQLPVLVTTWKEVRAAPGRIAKRRRMATLFGGLDAEDLPRAAAWLAGEAPPTGVGWATFSAAAAAAGPAVPGQDAPTLAEVEQRFAALAATSGEGSTRRRLDLLGDLLARCDDDARELLGGLLLGELRQGALRALVIEALAEALGAPAAAVRRAVMLSGSLGDTAAVLRREGPEALARIALTPLVAVGPMLAATAEGIADALAELGPEIAVEHKLDGVRVQVHRKGTEVRVFTRSLRDVTTAVPEVVTLARALAVDEVILDGEVVAYDAGGRPVPFQDLMSSFSTEIQSADAAELDAAASRPARLEPVFFDVLYAGGEALVDRPDRERRAVLEDLLPPARRIARRIVTTAAEVEVLVAESLAHGHEGLMLKSLDAAYAAGRRGRPWQKLKPVVTVDLVVLAAEWGHGRRQGWLSNLWLGARDAADPARFWMLGKTFKGLTDAMLRELTVSLQALAIRRTAHVVHVRPELVVEIAYDSALRSRRYDSGLALRFARVKRLRPDKRAEDATTLDEIRDRHAARGQPP